MNEEPSSRRLVAERRQQIVADFEWLVDREDEEGFRRWLTDGYGLVEGSEPFEQALEAWREKLREKRSRQQPS